MPTPYMENDKFIFISYSHKDSIEVTKVIERMQREGYCIWYDEGIDPGTEWDKNIAEHVENCDYFIAFISKNYISSSNCKDELNFARDLEKKRFLVYIEEIDLPSEMKMRLSRIQNIHKYKYSTDKDFYNKFFSADGLNEFKNELIEKKIEAPQIINNYKTVSYYELIKVNNSREIDIEQIRSKHNIDTSLSVPIGIDDRGKAVSLDIHNNGDGPNGIVVGPENSGKSELLYTFLLGLALSYSQNEVEFQLIDFSEKNSREIIKLPHCKGSLTNLNNSDMDKFISMLRKEERRRIELFERYELKDIYQYNSAQKKSPNNMEFLSHIVVVIDEIKRIKVEYPNALQEIKEIVSNASVLGIHLIYTTSSVHGLIDDSLNNLADFRICSEFQKNVCADAENSGDIMPGSFLIQSQKQECPQHVNIGFSGSIPRLTDKADELSWFFIQKSDREILVDLIKKHESKVLNEHNKKQFRSTLKSKPNKLEVGNIITFGKYKQNDIIEDIEWKILDIKDNKALIISDKTLDCQPYITGNQKANWQQSYIRRWLNNTFYLMAFSKDEQEQILPVRINEMLDESGCIDCYDKVLLLTSEEAEKYFAYDDERLSKPTEYAISLGAITGEWWLKSGAYCASSYDEFSGGEISWCNTYSCHRGVKPCIWIKL